MTLAFLAGCGAMVEGEATGVAVDITATPAGPGSPTVLSFEMWPTEIRPGHSVTLTWNAIAASVFIIPLDDSAPDEPGSGRPHLRQSGADDVNIRPIMGRRYSPKLGHWIPMTKGKLLVKNG